jgi:hypothetical protein
MGAWSMRWALGLAAVALVGCKQGEGTLVVTVTADARLADVAVLHVTADDGAASKSFDVQLTPQAIDPTSMLTFAIVAPASQVMVTVAAANARGDTVGSGSGAQAVKGGGKSALTVTLHAATTIADLGGADLGGVDLATGDLGVDAGADLASADLSGADRFGVDLATVDFGGVVVNDLSVSDLAQPDLGSVPVTLVGGFTSGGTTGTAAGITLVGHLSWHAAARGSANGITLSGALY